MKKNIFAIIEARMTSSRLPGKVLKLLNGKPSLELMVERLKKSQYLDGIIIATTVNATDDPIENLARRLGVHCFRGSEEDVLLRVVEAAEKFHVDTIVEVTGDCPLIDHRIVDEIISVYLQGNFDYVANCLQSTYPVGMDTQVFSTRNLRAIEQLTQDPADREHVSLYFYEKPGRYKVFNVESGLSEKDSQVRLTLDTKEDWQLLDEITKRLYPQNPDFSLKDILNLLAKHSELRELNQQIKQKNVR